MKHTDPADVNWFVCDQCAFKTIRKNSLNAHINARHRPFEDIVWFECEYCAYKSKNKSNLKKHIMAKHTDPGDIKWLKCEQCSFETKRKDGLRDHVMVKHTNPENVQWLYCEHCPYKSSHDSTTYAITKNSKMSPDARAPIQYLKFMEPLLRPFMFNWSKTQSVDIAQQLNGGIRYFDLRIATKAASAAFYFVHNLYCEQVDAVFAAINRFLDTHPKEVVILDCQHFFSFNSNAHKRFISLIASVFDKKLLPYTPKTARLSLERMIRIRCQVIVIYRSFAVKLEEFLWPSASLPTPWPNTVSTDRLIACLNEGLKNRNYASGYVSQCVLTPTLWFAIRHLFSSLEAKCVLPLEKQKYAWLRKQKPGVGGVNIVISDFVHYQDNQFSREVISLNQKLLDKF
ncbi:PI-PLC X domain-containing protein 3 [Asbolus verrucosus]|uniref:PI-PLC X domain-containing protein 3 n=1 Tax=Asbolus verrucosus TaxID=1661398 RepID=A0A482WD15_ASBVE|nr:PI-PLC X domain-containing protein 3 [Asbolus verrucosus]